MKALPPQKAFAWLRKLGTSSRPFFYGAVFVLLFGQLYSYSAPATATGNVTKEPDLRAAIIVGIIRYTYWPNATGSENEMTVCNFGRTSSDTVLTEKADNIVIHGKKFKYRKILADGPFEVCDVTLLGADIGEWTMQFNNQLTICDGCDPDTTPAMVTLKRSRERIGFDVDVDRARMAGIKFSSDMLELASSITDTRQ